MRPDPRPIREPCASGKWQRPTSFASKGRPARAEKPQVHTHSNPLYRPEIDGLRALSLVGVLLFHARFGILPGGYVGVDVFFVISGYLITSIIARDLDSNTFSFLSFYERRARRILPALAAMLVLCYLPAAWLLMPGDFVDFAKSACAAVLSLSNFWFFLVNGDYFRPMAERQPLLHTWSLAVEEQFYALFPLVMVILWRRGRRAVLATLFGMTLISFALSEWWMRAGGRPGATFFLPPFRAWELLIGSLVAMLPAAALERLRTRRFVGDSVCGAGLAIIVGCMLCYDDETTFPGVAALVPTVGAAVVIAFADRHTFVGRLLAHPLPVGIGLISYSSYLVHQPLFAFTRIAVERKLDAVESGLVLVASIALGYLGWRFIEQPFRNRERIGGRAMLAAGGGITVVIAVVSWVIFLGGGIPERFSRKRPATGPRPRPDLGRPVCHEAIS